MLNITKQAGDFDKYVKFNGKSGRWYMKNEAGEEVEITPTSFIADLENIKTGWMYFAAGAAPDKVFDASLSQPAPKPSENHKRGFAVRLFSKGAFGGVVELSGTSMHLCNAVNDLYTAFEVDKAKNAGKAPVVKYNGTTAQKDKHGTNYKPNFVIEKWVDVPAELSGYTETKAPVAPATVSSVSEF
jgi:hypothetical protein